MTSRLKVSSDLLLSAIFADVEPQPNVRLVGVSFNEPHDLVTLELTGPDLPEGDVVAQFSVTRRRVEVEFKKR